MLLRDFRCSKCNKLLARYIRCQELEIKCTRCGTQNIIANPDTLPGFQPLSYCQYLIPIIFPFEHQPRCNKAKPV